MAKNRLLVEDTPPPPLDREFTVVGRSLNRVDGVEKVTGRAVYAGDLKLPGMLFGRILHCPHPRARIVKIDTSKAEGLPGVRALLTKDNTEGWRTYWYTVPQIALPECITYEGQEVAVVATEDAAIAQKAIELIEVEYDVLPPMIDAEETLQNPPPPCVANEEYPGRDLLDRKRSVIQRGDVERGFREADVIVEDTYTTRTQYHGTIQTRACVADWDGHQLTVWDATQGIWNSKETLAKSFGLNPENVRVIVNYLGGGFGSKAWSQRISFFAAKLSMMIGRPVRIENTRGKEFLTHPHRWDCKIDLKMGAKKDGTLTAIYERAIVNIGAAALTTNYYPIGIIWHTSNLYECPNVELEQVGVYTNLQMTGPTRAPMNMNAIYPLESHMERLATELGIDPLEIRLKNYATHGRTHINPAVRDRNVRIPWSSKKLDECMKAVTKEIGWERRKDLPHDWGSKRRGMGMAAFIANQAAGKVPNTAYADVEIKKDGTITLFAGVVDIGGGQKTIFGMIAAEELGVEMEDVTVFAGDTRNTRYAPAGHTSRVTAEMGPAVLQAAANARQQLFEIAAEILGVGNVQELESRNGKIYVKADPSKSIPFRTACSRLDLDWPIRGGGSRATTPDEPMFASFGAQAAEVEVDVETGRVDIIRIVAAQDFGKAINPKFCVSQIYGGIEFGVGFALSEEGIFDPKSGKMLNHNLHHYGMPTAFDIPPVDAILVEGEDPYFAYSAKGGAEITNTPTPGVIRNAICHALGLWLNELPMTPDRILEAIRKKGAVS